MTRSLLPVLRPAEESLPPLLARWVGAALGGALPLEANATCGDCAMTSGSGTTFDPRTKCCTFLPTIPNFGVGGALRAGVVSVKLRVRAGRELSPLGLVADPGEVARRTEVSAFGRDASLACPHYASGTGACGVWAWRESTCATWFCKHTRGAVAKAMWNRVHALAAALERAVAWRCAVELGVPAEGLARAAPLRSVHGSRADLEAGGDPRSLWGRWATDVEGYFVACAELAEAMPAEEALAAGGSEVSALAVIARRALDVEMDESLPPRVVMGAAQVLAMGRESVRVQGYSHLDPLEVPRALFDRLHCFDGREVADALRAASDEAGEEVPAGAVRMLLDFGVLRGG